MAKALGAILSNVSMADIIPNLSVGIAAEASDNIDVTIQFLDFDGTNLAGYHQVMFSVSDSQYGAFGTGITDVSVTTGTLLYEQQVNRSGWAGSDSTGLLVMRFNFTSAGTRYLNLLTGSRWIVTSALTWA